MGNPSRFSNTSQYRNVGLRVMVAYYGRKMLKMNIFEYESDTFYLPAIRHCEQCDTWPVELIPLRVFAQTSR
jgi:hypothetical protein